MEQEASPARSVGEGCVSLTDAEVDEVLQVDTASKTSDLVVIDGWLKFRDCKKWKQRWGVVTKLSPAADCLHLQLYRDCRDHYRQGQTKASLSLQHFLALETGFTLDKESNTMAIVCQDITVVLAFDSRELLIQWQVKIATNLGEDQQILVQVAAAPARSKISPGPAHLHIREHRFCLTSGVPPRLHGFWEINHLRKFGVVEGKFCFEGGSQCGKGEGLHVLMTDQGEDIAQALHLASQGKPVSRKRSVARNVSVMESSPRRANHWRADPLRCASDALHQSCAELTGGAFSGPGGPSSTCSSSLYGSHQLPWPSSETSRIDSSDFGDTCSFAEQVHTLHQEWNDEKLDVCHCSAASPIPAKRFSSSSTACAANGCSSLHSKNVHQPNRCDSPSQHSTISRLTESSTYQVPARTIHCMSPKNLIEKKCQMAASCSCHSPKKCALPTANEPVQPFCNYDTPKSAIMSINKDTAISVEDQRDSMTLPPDENYDKPRNLTESEFIAEATSLQYSNYDVPPSSLQFPPMSVTPQCTKVVMEREDCQMLVCPCNRVFNWLSLPYCRRGYGIESSKMCKVSFGNILLCPFFVNGYCFEMLKNRVQRPRFHETNQPISTEAQQESVPTMSKADDSRAQVSAVCASAPEESLSQNIPESSKPVQTNNYANLEFADSLMLYENSRDIISRVATSVENSDKNESSQSENTQNEVESRVEFDNRGGQSCCKCGHSCGEADKRKETENVVCDVKKQDDYTLMDPDDFKDSIQSRTNLSSKSGKWASEKQESESFQEYLHMSPLTNRDDAGMAQPVFSSQKHHLRSESISHFPAAFLPRKSLDMCKVPGRPVPFIDQSSVSASTSPYLRRHFRFFRDDLSYQTQTSQFDRRRSNSVDYGNYLDSTSLPSAARKFGNNVMVNSGRLREAAAGPPLAVFDNDIVKVEKSEKESVGKRKTMHGENSPSGQQMEASPVAVRRSCSVPCKSAHNRDSSSSNDSGVSAGSPKRQVEFELASCPEKSATNNPLHNSSCIHSSLPRKSKSIDPLQELTFQFQIAKRSVKASDETPAPHENKESYKGSGNTSTTTILGIDSQSTSSATSDMSDYIETLSLSSYSSSDTPDGLRLSRTAVITLKPRSGKEYHKVDRCYILDEESKRTNSRVSTTIPEKSESPSPGYASGSPGN
ncbi:uncharacterized protein LOC111049973 [Nilaparvata lugens]|uniref:uncharacterized protein LOC111049973 n=1 Tax=Nilaparvata lugens TaxID=108931 RepID=UPI00193E1B55|nr:uncharacterized protein LOC111049973 [Nilaparvata lugens]